jgi:hypothetical protein
MTGNGQAQSASQCRVMAESTSSRPVGEMTQSILQRRSLRSVPVIDEDRKADVWRATFGGHDNVRSNLEGR